MKPFEFLDISGDAGIRAFGGTPEELFVNAALAMYSLVTDLEGVGERREIAISVRGSTIEGLMVAWLNELVFQLDAFGFIGKKVTITAFGENALSANVAGEDFDPGRHEQKLLVKAATYHRVEVKEKNGGWTAQVIFDI